MTSGFASVIGDAVGAGVGAGAIQAGAYAAFAGTTSYLTGGSFLSGALTGAAGSVVGSLTGLIPGIQANGWGTAAQVGSSAAFAGIVSDLSGGNFWTGAAQGAIIAGFNHAAHRILDLTSAFDEQLIKTKEFFESRRLYYDNMASQTANTGSDADVTATQMNRMKEFVDFVKTSSPYDIKNLKGSKFSNRYIGKRMAMYKGQIFRTDDFGNYNYGVAAKAYGLSLKFSQFGAGMYQILSRTSSIYWGSTYFDDPRDYNMIGRGYRHFN